MPEEAGETGSHRGPYLIQVGRELGRGTTLPRLVAQSLLDSGGSWAGEEGEWIIGFRTAAARDAALRHVRSTYGELAARAIGH